MPFIFKKMSASTQDGVAMAGGGAAGSAAQHPVPSGGVRPVPQFTLRPAVFLSSARGDTARTARVPSASGLHGRPEDHTLGTAAPAGPFQMLCVLCIPLHVLGTIGLKSARIAICRKPALCDPSCCSWNF